MNSILEQRVICPVCQVFKDRLNITLPVKMPDLFAEEAAGSAADAAQDQLSTMEYADTSVQDGGDGSSAGGGQS